MTLKEKRELKSLEESANNLFSSANVSLKEVKEEVLSQGEEVLVPIETVHETEWIGMPEFHQEDTSSFQGIKIHFRNENDRLEFEKLIGQKFTNKTKSAWFPAYDLEKPSNFLYTGKPS
jgi:hypothetical protein